MSFSQFAMKYGSKLLLLFPILPKIVKGKKCQKNEALTEKRPALVQIQCY